MDTYQPTMNLRGALDRFRDIYSGAFSEWTGSQQMRETFAIAEPIGMMDMAIRYWRQPQATVALNPGRAGLCPILRAWRIESFKPIRAGLISTR